MVPPSCDDKAILAPSWGLAGWLGLIMIMMKQIKHVMLIGKYKEECIFLSCIFIDRHNDMCLMLLFIH